MSVPTLDRNDVSYAALVEMQRRLLAATLAGTVTWEKQGNDFTLAKPAGMIAVEPDRIAIYDDRGRRLREFQPGDKSLYTAISEAHEAIVCELLDRMIADLDALATDAA